MVDFAGGVPVGVRARAAGNRAVSAQNADPAACAGAGEHGVDAGADAGRLAGLPDAVRRTVPAVPKPVDGDPPQRPLRPAVRLVREQNRLCPPAIEQAGRHSFFAVPSFFAAARERPRGNGLIRQQARKKSEQPPRPLRNTVEMFIRFMLPCIQKNGAAAVRYKGRAAPLLFKKRRCKRILTRTRKDVKVV